MSGLVAALMGLAALFAGRAVHVGRRARVLGRVLPSPGGKGPRSRRPWPALLDDWRVRAAAGAVCGLALGGPIGSILGASAGATTAFTRARRRRASSKALAEEQLTDAVRSVSAAMRAGLSVQQSLAYAAGEAEEPLGASLRSLIDGLEVGTPLEESLVAWGSSIGTDDALLLAGVLRLHRRSGGDLPAVLDQVVATLRDRRAASLEVRALTAQARLSGTILGILPVGFFAFLWLTSRRDIEAAFRNPAGVGAIAIGLCLDAAAFVWMRRLLVVR